jgi:hypothetical protein
VSVIDLTDFARPILHECRMVPAEALLKNLTSTTMPEKKKGSKRLLPPFHDGAKAYLSNVMGTLDAAGPKDKVFVTAERFMVRRLHTKSIETVGVMNGLLAAGMMSKGHSLRLIGASDWKHHVNKSFDLDELYKKAHQELRVEPHRIDSLLIAVFAYCQLVPMGMPTEDWVWKLLEPLKKPGYVKKERKPRKGK